MIRLENFTNPYYPTLISWIHNEEELMQFGGPAFTFPLTSEQLENSLADKNRFAYCVIDIMANLPIGHAEIYLANTSAFLGRILIGKKEQRNNGIGVQVMKLLLDVAFIRFEKTKVELNVFDWNIGAIRCYEKAGFTINPNKKSERKIKNETWTALNMTLDKLQWQALKSENNTKKY